jgi:hypothetical protein
LRQFHLPYVSRQSEACPKHRDCSLVAAHPGPCYLIGWLTSADMRIKLRAVRAGTIRVIGRRQHLRAVLEQVEVERRAPHREKT